MNRLCRFVAGQFLRFLPTCQEAGIVASVVAFGLTCCGAGKYFLGSKNESGACFGMPLA
jgi:hypothetical protein